jgi:hypothetical protein
VDPGFQVRGAHLKKLRRVEGGAKIYGVFRVKNHDFTPKNHIFPIAEGGARPGSALESYGCLAPLSTIFQLHRNFRCKFITTITQSLTQISRATCSYQYNRPNHLKRYFKLSYLVEHIIMVNFKRKYLIIILYDTCMYMDRCF